MFSDFQHHRQVSVQAGQAARFFDAVHHVANVADAHRAPVHRGHDDTGEIQGPLNAPHGAQCEFAGTLIDAPAGDLDVLGGQRAPYCIDGQVVGVELVAVQPDLHLALALADKAHLPHAWGGFDVLLDAVVYQLGNLPQVAAG